MEIVNKIKSFFNSTTTEVPSSLTLSEINSFFGANATDFGSDLSEITYFTCLKVLSESVGKLSIQLNDSNNNKVSDHEAFKMLKNRPNQYMSPFTFKTLMEYQRNHYGNAYAYINRNFNGSLEGIYPLDARQVRIWVNDVSDFTDIKFIYRYYHSRSGKEYLINPSDIIHLKAGISQDGLSGMCVRETLARNMEGNKASQNFLNNLYQKGLTANAVVKYVGDLDKKKKQMLLKELAEFGASTSDKIIPLPLGFDLQPLDLKLTDSQYYELKKFSSLQIAAAFGIKPNYLNNYDKSSYSNSEMQNLSFYVDTLLSNLTCWEEELNYKLLTEKEIAKGLSFKFNIATILRGDLKTQSEALSTYVGGSIYTVNEARKKAGLPPAKNGDVILVNGSFVRIEEIGKAYEKGGE